ncbi:MAG: glycosyltransferase [Elusimicrobia bacterium]|nr:glycosyltransferase [Elusimicrobiota bacterium]
MCANVSGGERILLVSVLLCTYDQKDYVVEAVESVLSQSYPCIELIVIDNGSTDGSAELLQPYHERGQLRLLAHATNAPLTQRLNEGVRECHGDYVSILYGDDYYLPEKIARQVHEFSSLPSDFGVVYSPGYRLSQQTGQRTRSPSLRASGFVLDEMLENFGRAWISPISPLIRRACFADHPFDESVRLIADSVLFFLALSYRFHYLDVPLVVMRDHGSNVGWAYKRNFEEGLIVFDHLQRHPRFPARLRGRLVAIRATWARDLAWKISRFGSDGREARRYLLRAVRWQPQQAVHPRTWAGLLLSLLPRVVRQRVNGAISRLRGQHVDLAYRDDYD